MSTEEAVHETVNAVKAGLFEQLSTDPLEFVKNHPHYPLVAALLLSLPLVASMVSPAKKKKVQMAKLSIEDYDPVETQLDALWEIAGSQNMCAVAEHGMLRVLEFSDGAPTADHIVATLLKAMNEPRDGLPVEKPKHAVFLDTAVISDSTLHKVSNACGKFNLSISRMDKLQKEHPELLLLKQKAIDVVQKPQQAVSQGPVTMNKAPNRGCFTCHKEIEGKASQCSACKAVIYCSPACAKQDWPNHKQSCQNFKRSMARADVIHLS